MEKSIEGTLCQAVVSGDEDAVSQLLLQGANPNKTATHGKTSLGEAATIGNTTILKLLIDGTSSVANKPTTSAMSRKHNPKSYKRKHKSDSHEETVIKYKNVNDRLYKDYYISQCGQNAISSDCTMHDGNQGYYVIIHSEGSSSDESKKSSLKSPMSPICLTPSSQAELEWDEDIGNVAPTTKEDETWSSMYKWYAAILESTGAAMAAASMITNGVDQQDAFMRTALHYAAEQGHVEAVKLLLEANCKLDIAASDGLTPLHVAVIRNHIEITTMLLNAGSHVNFKTHEKMTPLHFASSRGYTGLVKILVKHGANIEARDTNERTALYLAAGRGHKDVIEHLIVSGANVNIEEIHGYTPLCEAVWQRHADVVGALLSAGARITHSHKLLHNAVIQRQKEIVKMLATLSGVNLHDDNGDTPLLLAARLSEPEILQILLENGSHVNACNSITGANALHLAVECADDPKDFEKILMCLLNHKIYINTMAVAGGTALTSALLFQKDYAATLLIQHGADVNVCDIDAFGFDNLSIASRRHSYTLTSMLVKAGHYRVFPDHNVPVPKPDTTLYRLYCSSKHPLSLSDLCRIKIRNMSNTILHLYINSLPLPKRLKRFLMLEDL